MDDDRVIRIARALCRSARLDPDKPVDDGDAGIAPQPPQGERPALAAWMLFRETAKTFIARDDQRPTAPF